MQTWPSSAASIVVTSGAGNGLLGDWTEIVAADAIPDAIQIAGFVAQLYTGATNGVDRLEIQIGIGAEDEEEMISAPLLVSASAGNLNNETWMLPIAIAGIAAGSRVSLRTRSAGTSVAYTFVLMYTTGIGDAGSTTAAYQYAPYDADGGDQTGTSVTPSATPWDDSAWAEVITLLGRGSAIIGVGAAYPSAAYDGVEYEIDIGTGEIGEETVLTTIRSVFSEVGPQGYCTAWLPAPRQISVDSRISYRLRKAGTSVTPLTTHVLYFDLPIPPPTPPTTTYPTVRERIFALPFSMNLVLFLERIEFLIQAGEGLVTGQGSDPVVAVWFSKDGGKTYGNGYTVRPGKMGEYTKRSYLNRIGRARNWVCKIRVSDPVFWAFLDCYVDMSEGTS